MKKNKMKTKKKYKSRIITTSGVHYYTCALAIFSLFIFDLFFELIFKQHILMIFSSLNLVFSYHLKSIKKKEKEIMLCPHLLFLFRDLSFGIRKLHQIHFVFLLIVLGYQSLFYTSSLSSSLDLISIVGKEFTSHRIQILSFFISSLCLLLVFIFGSEIY